MMINNNSNTNNNNNNRLYMKGAIVGTLPPSNNLKQFQKPGCQQSKNTTAGEPCTSGPQREPDPKDAPITAMQFHPITPEHNSIKLMHTQIISSPEED